MKVYVINTDVQYDGDALIDDKIFKKEAERQNEVYEVEEFNKLFNGDESYLFNPNNRYVKLLD